MWFIMFFKERWEAISIFHPLWCLVMRIFQKERRVMMQARFLRMRQINHRIKTVFHRQKKKISAIVVRQQLLYTLYALWRNNRQFRCNTLTCQKNSVCSIVTYCCFTFIYMMGVCFSTIPNKTISLFA